MNVVTSANYFLVIDDVFSQFKVIDFGPYITSYQ